MSNTLKEKLKTDEPVLFLAANIDMNHSQLEVALGNGSYDAVYFDAQHSVFSEEKLAEFCAATESLEIPTQMRIPHTRFSYLAGRYCDFGLSSIVIPEVMEESTVTEAIEYFYYGPFGRRSWGGRARAGMRFFDGAPDRQEYAKWWNDNAVLCIQFESVEAVTNARKLADRPGVDFVGFGPNDLLFSLERKLEYPFKTIEECYLNVASQLDEVGIRRGPIITTKPEERDRYLELGITVFYESPKF